MKHNIKKYMLIIFEILILIGIGFFSYYNFNQDVQFFCFLMQKVYVTKLIFLALFFAILGFAAGFILRTIAGLKVAQMCDAYQKRHENISIEKEDDKARIGVLEAKIKTLETALEAALKKQ